MNYSRTLAALMIAIATGACSGTPSSPSDDQPGGAEDDATGVDTDTTLPAQVPEAEAEAETAPTPAPTGSGGAPITDGGAPPDDGGNKTPKTDAGAPPPAPACAGKTEIEPNDQNQNANPLGAITCGKLAPGDVDRFKLDSKEDRTYTLVLDSAVGARLTVVRPNGGTAIATGPGAKVTFSGRGGRVDVIVSDGAAQSYRILLSHD